MANIYLSVRWAINTANDDSHGYSQVNRTGPDYDCSSFVTEALLQGNFQLFDGSTPITSCGQVSTSNIESVLSSSGFTQKGLDNPSIGDIYFWDGSGNQGHAFICISSSMIAEAASDRGHPETGDQTGTEVWVTNIRSSFSDHNWKCYSPPASSFGQWSVAQTGGFLKESNEAIGNAYMIWNILSQLGWTVNAVCGLLGNLEVESGYNPWRYEGDNIQSMASAQSWGYGYGLVQFTPCRKYQFDSRAQQLFGYGPNWSDQTGSLNDGTAQLIFIDRFADYYPTSSYPETYSQFKQSNATADYLARVWIYNYERPADPSASIAQREAAALYWYSILSGTPPGPGPWPGTIPVWLMKKIRDRKFKM